jgi:ParB family transcriptional regulator, chromosome partitioning protein
MILTPDYRNLDIHDINCADETFRITTRRSVDDLIPSIRRIGLVNPPVLCPGQPGYRIVSGFRRVAALRQMGQTQLNARVLPRQEPEWLYAQLAVADNSLVRELNLLEQSRSLNLLSRFIPDQAQLPEIARELHLPDNVKAIAKLKRLTGLSDPIREGVMSEAIALPVALELEEMEFDDAALMADVLNQLQLSLNKQREVLTFAKEIALRDDRTLAEVFCEEPLRKVLANEEYDRAYKVRKVRDYLKLRRFPQLTSAQAEFEHATKALKLGSRARLLAPPFFEGGTYQLALTFKRLDQLKEHHGTIDRILGSTFINNKLADIS